MERVRGSPLERTTSAPGTSRAAPSAATALSLRTISSVFSIGARASALRTAARTSARFSLDPRSRARSSSALAFALSAVVLSRGATSLKRARSRTRYASSASVSSALTPFALSAAATEALSGSRKVKGPSVCGVDPFSHPLSAEANVFPPPRSLLRDRTESKRLRTYPGRRVVPCVP